MELKIVFTYDHVSGNFLARTPNGSFSVRRKDIEGPLENALGSLKRQTISANSEKFIKPKKARKLQDTYDESQVQRVGVGVSGIPEHPELELDLGELELVL